MWNATNANFNDFTVQLKTLNGVRYMEFYLNGAHQFTQVITGWTNGGNYFGAMGDTTVGAYSYTYIRSLRVSW